MRRVIKYISILALFLSGGWFAFSPGFEPVITFLFGLAGLLGAWQSSTENVSSKPNIPDVGVVSPIAIAPRIKEIFLDDANRQCSICHRKSEVNLYPIDPATASKKLGFDNLIVLCPDCYQKARKGGITPDQLRAVKKTWMSICKSGESPSVVSQVVEQAYSDAVRLSLSPDIFDVKRARIKCQEILHYYNPFHSDAQILCEKLLWIEKARAAEMFPEDDKYHSIIRITSRPLVIVFLPLLLLYEISTYFVMYLVGSVKNAYGKNMPLHIYLKNMGQYIEINDLPLKEGIIDAIKYGRITVATVNLSRIRRDWYGKIEELKS